MRYKDFRHLPKIENKNRFSDQSQIQKDQDTPSQLETDADIFDQAMQDVKPLPGQKKGRKVHLHKQSPAATHLQEPVKSGKQYLQELVEGKTEFEIELTKEYMQGNVRGLDLRIFKKLKEGKFSPEAYLDLHGLNAENAQIGIVHFIKENYLSGKRCILIIPGRGKNSPQGKGVLREHIQVWLTREPLKRVVLAFSTAQPQHGGAGAIYVLLRKYKKTRGKIFWDRYQLDDLS